MANAKRIGILTGGGDAPGLNGIIEASCRTLFTRDYEVIGICDGFEGVFACRTIKLDQEIVSGAHVQAGTLLGASNKSWIAGREAEFLERYRALDVIGLIVAGGDGTFDALKKLGGAVPVIGVPKTIDNDLSGTEVTFGFDTACSVVADAADALRATAHAHRRVIVIEAMGRTAGWLALGGGLASYADAILIPERPFSREKLSTYIKGKQKNGKRGLVIVVSEGAFAEGDKPKVAFTVKGSKQAERYGGIAEALARWVESETGWEARHVVLGHLQRARQPTVTDRFLTVAMGVEVSRMVFENAWGNAVVYRNGGVQRAPIDDLMKPARLVDPEHRWVQLAQSIGVFI
jgi:6-phosphofructokinase 1